MVDFFNKTSADIETMLNEEQKKILEGLNEAQRNAALNFNGLQFVEAAPGSGKTKLIISKTALMLSLGIPAHNILLFTFTKKAADEMKKRLLTEIGNIADAITVSTYHSFCAKQLRKYASLIGYQGNYSIYSPEESFDVLKDIIKKQYDTQLAAEDMAKLISSFKDRYISPEKVLERAGTNQGYILRASIYKSYMEKMRSNNAMDFDDLIFNFVLLLETYPDIKESIHNQFKYVTADEVQDSSVLDVRLLINLIPTPHNMYIVGDTDQSIYSFRGASMEFLVKASTAYKFNVMCLGRNYRSSQTIVNSASQLIQFNKERVGNKEVYTTNAAGEPIMVYEAKDADSEARHIINTIRTLHDKYDYKYNDIAILMRISALSDPFEQALIKANIPYCLYTGISLTERAVVKDIVSYIRLINNPSDMAALKRALTTPKRGLGEKAIEEIYNIMTTIKSYDIIKSMLEVKEKLSRRYQKSFAIFIEELREITVAIEKSKSTGDLCHVIDIILHATHYNEFLRKKADNELEYTNNMSIIQQFKQIAAAFTSVDELLESFVDSADEDESNEDKVSLMTVHRSKGLEFKAVFIIGVADGIMPHRMSLQEGKAAEELRLMYVAMTRAKDLLVISYPKKIVRNATLEQVERSRFIDMFIHGGNKITEISDSRSNNA